MAQDPQGQVLSTKEICPRGTEGREQEAKTGARGQGRREKGRPLDREETDMGHRKMAVHKGTRENPIYDEVFNFNWACQLGKPNGTFDC